MVAMGSGGGVEKKKEGEACTRMQQEQEVKEREGVLKEREVGRQTTESCEWSLLRSLRILPSNLTNNMHQLGHIFFI